MRLWIAIHLPQLPLEVFCPRWSTDQGTVVLEQERVIALSAAAYEAGVRRGLRRGGAIMLAPHTQFQQRSLPLEAEALQATALALLQFTPQLAEAEEATLLLDVGASLRLFGGIRALCHRVAQSVRALGFTGTLSCAPTARGAWMLARSNAGRALTMASLERRLDSLPPGLLPPARAYLDWLEGIGCLTIGQLRRLPRPGLQRRCGRALLDMLDDAHGARPEMHQWLAAPASFHAKLELFDRVENAEALLFGAHRLVLQLTGWLSAHQLAVERIQLLLEHERGRVAGPPTVVEIMLAEPTWKDTHLVRLLKERLAKLALPAPVIGLCLEAPQVQPMAPPSESLFPEPGGSKEDWQRLLELLAARLGADNVLQAAPNADYRPEHANSWVSIQTKIRPAEARAQLPSDIGSLPRPTWLLPKPIALMMRDHRPYYGSPLRIRSTGERIESGWWGAMQTRDYFMAQGEDNAHYWLFKERDSGATEPETRWYLHGLFG
ncbi:DNA polymerase Y family protein [Duganella sp. FT109W]|uniref:DNA polymerase Y family protein n=1 Tax=Duganella margarita TaxID=2692170 RepID=A0A7X4H1U1_9BURK|nr:DNA polymerase Y family protein [Duganella margarita]MYM73141.1 DNA polymerase Y family protein [Duganella margarita]MYN38722.1 DNA polymerase Y family protein [Duganella margarita]